MPSGQTRCQREDTQLRKPSPNYQINYQINMLLNWWNKAVEAGLDPAIPSVSQRFDVREGEDVGGQLTCNYVPRVGMPLLMTDQQSPRGQEIRYRVVMLGSRAGCANLT